MKLKLKFTRKETKAIAYIYRNKGINGLEELKKEVIEHITNDINYRFKNVEAYLIKEKL